MNEGVSGSFAVWADWLAGTISRTVRPAPSAQLPASQTSEPHSLHFISDSSLQMLSFTDKDLLLSKHFIILTFIQLRAVFLKAGTEREKTVLS